MAGKAGNDITPELEIAWARAVSRAVDDPAFCRRLEADPEGVLEEFGVDVPEGVVGRGDLKPTLKEAIPAIEKQRKIVQAALQSSTGAAACSYVAPVPLAQPVMVSYAIPYYASAQPHTHVSPPPPSAPFYASIQPYTSGSHAYGYAPYASAPWASLYASQVATTRAITAPSPIPPQWLGGPPSGGQLPMW